MTLKDLKRAMRAHEIRNDWNVNALAEELWAINERAHGRGEEEKCTDPEPEFLEWWRLPVWCAQLRASKNLAGFWRRAGDRSFSDHFARAERTLIRYGPLSVGSVRV